MIAMSNTPLEQGIYKLSMMVGHKYSYQTGWNTFVNQHFQI
jgi:hypothetical protein